MKLDKPYIIEEFDNYSIKINETGGVSITTLCTDSVTIFLDSDELMRLASKAKLFRERRVAWRAKNAPT